LSLTIVGSPTAAVVTVGVSVAGATVGVLVVEPRDFEGLVYFVVAFGAAFGVERVVDGFGFGFGVAEGSSVGGATALPPRLGVSVDSVGVGSSEAAGVCDCVERATAAAGITMTDTNTKIWMRTMKRELKRSARLRRRFGGRLIGGADACSSSPFRR
jgi:hypothetical protein